MTFTMEFALAIYKILGQRPNVLLLLLLLLLLLETSIITVP